MNGLTTNVTGSDVLIYILILLFLIIIGFIFRLESVILMILLVPALLIFIGFGVLSNIGAIILIILAFAIGYALMKMLR